MNPKLLLLAATLSAAFVPAQQTIVDYPDSTLADPPALFFPFYTSFPTGPGSTATVRYQTLCPSTFPGLPTTPQILTGIGVQIAGRARYERFELRAGIGAADSLTNAWLTNLPGQRLQRDLSNTVLAGGQAPDGTPASRWIVFDLDAPFLWAPGESIVLDVISKAADPFDPAGFVLTATHLGGQRAFSLNYVDGDPLAGSVQMVNGLKLRFLFEAFDPVTAGAATWSFGRGCASPGNAAPDIAVSGSTQLGGTANITTSGGNGNPGLLFLGLSRFFEQGVPEAFPLSLGGRCLLLHSALSSQAVTAGGTTAISVPSVPALAGIPLYAQWAQLDGGSPSSLPFTVSRGVGLLFY